MFVTMFAAALLLVQAGNADRTAYVSCLKNAVVSAKSANVGVDAFKDYAHKTCAAIEESFKAKLVAFNLKNGMSKKAAAEDADIQLEDYVYTAEERYRYSLEPQ
ncbi:MAG: hypothetical protein ACLGHC_04160 [Alphaproteobacteria bacterium]